MAQLKRDLNLSLIGSGQPPQPAQAAIRVTIDTDVLGLDDDVPDDSLLSVLIEKLSITPGISVNQE